MAWTASAKVPKYDVNSSVRVEFSGNVQGFTAGASASVDPANVYMTTVTYDGNNKFNVVASLKTPLTDDMTANIALTGNEWPMRFEVRAGYGDLYTEFTGKCV